MLRSHWVRAFTVGLVTMPIAAVPLPQVNCCTGQNYEIGEWAGQPWSWAPAFQAAFSVIHCGFDELSHAALIPTGPHAGRVLMWRRNCSTSQLTTETWIFDPANPLAPLIKVNHTFNSDIFCGTASWDPNGRLIVTGGFPNASSPANETFRFTPRALEINAIFPTQYPWQPPYLNVGGNWWTQLGSMSMGRYYPTLIALVTAAMGGPQVTCTLGSSYTGGHLVLSGPPVNSGTEGNEVWQVLPQGSSTWGCPIIPQGMLSTDPHYPASWPGTPEDYALLPTNDPPGKLLDSYARAFQLSLATNRQVFVAGDVDTSPSAVGPPAGNEPGDTWMMKVPHPSDLSPVDRWELWRGQPEELDLDRYYGASVILFQRTPSMRENRVINLGGGDYISPNGPFTVTTRVDEFEPGNNAQTGLWKTKTNGLLWPRLFLNAVLLPTRQILVEGGDRCHGGHCSDPAFCAELYEPGPLPNSPGSSTCLARPVIPPPVFPYTNPSPTPRLYHHLSVLLPDARVLVFGGNAFLESAPPGYDSVGGDSEFTGEIFSPPYLFQGSRPTIDNLPNGSEHAYGATFGLDVTIQEGVFARAVLLRPAAMTHHFDADQRYIELECVAGCSAGQGTSTISVKAPPSDWAPPGWYMLFVLEQKTTGIHTGKLVPSVAKFVRFS